MRVVLVSLILGSGVIGAWRAWATWGDDRPVSVSVPEPGVFERGVAAVFVGFPAGCAIGMALALLAAVIAGPPA